MMGTITALNPQALPVPAIVMISLKRDKFSGDDNFKISTVKVWSAATMLELKLVWFIIIVAGLSEPF